MPKCSVPNCGRPVLCRGLCTAHYQRLSKHGSLFESVPINPHSLPLELRFWSKVNKIPGEDACWLWTASTNEWGYGTVNVGGASELAHRVSWFLATGKWPAEQVLHTCDNPPCVRFPEHLFEGTNYDNVQDRCRKGRGNRPIGERNPAAKLTREKIGQILMGYASGKFSQKALALEFGISRSHVGNILAGRCWADI